MPASSGPFSFLSIDKSSGGRLSDWYDWKRRGYADPRTSDELDVLAYELMVSIAEMDHGRPPQCRNESIRRGEKERKKERKKERRKQPSSGFHQEPRVEGSDRQYPPFTQD
ncbi:MAG: hypothetical protein Q9176_007692 [Flavoplaca citrina]